MAFPFPYYNSILFYFNIIECYLKIIVDLASINQGRNCFDTWILGLATAQTIHMGFEGGDRFCFFGFYAIFPAFDCCKYGSANRFYSSLLTRTCAALSTTNQSYFLSYTESVGIS